MPPKNGPGWNSSKRNRKIGTEDQGFKRRNDFDIPASWHDDRIFWQKLKDPVALPCTIGSHAFTVLVEPTHRDYRHHVSISDLLRLVRHIPQDHRRDITVFAFRQPKRKEAIFAPAWGRMGYLADFGRYSGPSVLLEAQPVNFTYKIENNLSADMMRELALLEQEGHDVRLTKRHFAIQSPLEAIRRTQLFRTLIHEIGHYVDYLEKVGQLGEAPDATDDLQDRYFARPVMEREHFAEKYAASVRGELGAKGIIPFDPLPMSVEHRSKLNPEWFVFP